VLLVEGESDTLTFSNLDKALAEPDTDFKLFGKPEVSGKRRMGVALALGDSIEEAKAKAIASASMVKVTL
jgi:phosphoribosylglycinamide formyltransferase 2